ncbi:hypothetical protein OO006_09145 [Prosthecochloris sp. SCSIO W1101]|uniref:hypothetical protein n=1 Tax=Prosthecochloris sp. SCSIO W1101 TaxID=2992242 RepID=UPI00223D254E|nr:hypothetical protein [Prosthecochloris sp. SCSIO W1101]UZJ40523.1 hypothetical protein OO006_09145 [Prosthecochloris sp. SCSIO W1101]
MGRSYSEKTITFINWLKALALSPGVLFSAGYLVIYLLTNVYLNSALKNTILQEIETATENRYTISVEHLRAGIDLQSVTLRNLEFIPVKKQNRQEENSSLSLPNLHIEQVNLCNLLFSRQCVEHSTREISRHILCINHLLVLSLPQ